MESSKFTLFVLLATFVLNAFAALPTINVVQTAKDNGDRLTTKPSITFGADFSSNDLLRVNNTHKFQTILGFGGAITEAAASVYAGLNAANKKKVIDAYYGPDSIHYTVGRVHMNSCDFSVASYSEDDRANDYDLTNFTITHDLKWLIPLIKDAFAASSIPINLFLTPWSPPAWMKTNNKMDGSGRPCLKPDDKVHAAWALFFSKFITAYKAQNIPFWGLTVQNEPENDGAWESCVFIAAEQRDFLKSYLGPQLKKDHPEVKIMIFDHNKDHMVTWTQTVLSDPQAAAYVWGTGFHWYSGPQFENVLATHNLDPSKHLLATEACNCPGVRLGDWGRGESYGTDILGDLNNWAEGWVDWNILLNPQGGPNHVNNFCDAPIIADTSKQTVEFNVPYWYLGHFSKFIPPNSVRVQTTSPSGIQSTAFLRPDNYIALVVLNTQNAEKTFKLQHGTGFVKVTVPAHSIATLTYQNF